MIKKKRVTISILFAFLLVCGVCAMIFWISRPQEMPAIVFMHKQIRPDYSCGGIVFWDNCGNCYRTMEEDVCNLTWKEIYEEFTAGRLDNILKKKKICEWEEVYEYYKLLKKVAKNKNFDLVEYEHYPAVVTDTFYWYGMYYDKKGELSIITLQKDVCYMREYGNDENAVKICQWMDGEE